MLKKIILIFTSILLPSFGVLAADYYVSTSGSDNSSCGTDPSPCATIAYAVQNRVSDGDTVIVKDGTYRGRNTLTRNFPTGLTIKAQNNYKATLTGITSPGSPSTNADQALSIYTPGEKNITVEGFVFTNWMPGRICNGDYTREAEYLIHIENASNVTLRNNILYGNNAAHTCNEMIKINKGGDNYVRGIVVEGNVLYRPADAGGSDIIDSKGGGEIDIRDNIFFTEYDEIGDHSQSFITLKSQADEALGGGSVSHPRFKIRRNIFLNYGGKTDQAFIQFGEDGEDYDPVPQVDSALVENNLIIGNNTRSIVAPFQYKDSVNIITRANTIVGDLPGGGYCARLVAEMPAYRNSVIRDLTFSNNIFSDQTGTMGDDNIFVINQGEAVEYDLPSIVFNRNLYWNNGNSLPSGTSGYPLDPSDDSNSLIANPLLNENQNSIVLPEWDEPGGFASGSLTIREEFERLVNAYGALGDGSPAINAADASNMPSDDIRGLARDSTPDLGAFEYGATTPYVGDDDDDDDDDDDSDGPFTKVTGGCDISQNQFNMISYVLLIAIILSGLLFISRKRLNRY